VKLIITQEQCPKSWLLASTAKKIPKYRTLPVNAIAARGVVRGFRHLLAAGGIPGRTSPPLPAAPGHARGVNRATHKYARPAVLSAVERGNRPLQSYRRCYRGQRSRMRPRDRHAKAPPRRGLLRPAWWRETVAPQASCEDGSIAEDPGPRSCIDLQQSQSGSVAAFSRLLMEPVK
jgi:hypothetical protein